MALPQATGEHTYMYESKELFKDKDLLRDYQIPVFQDMLTAGNKTLLKAPMDYGKTFIGCVYVSYLFQTKPEMYLIIIDRLKSI